MDELELKGQIIEVGLTLINTGLVEGTGGNISARLPGAQWFYITPSGMPYHEIEPDDLVKVDLQGKIIEGKRKPSIEKDLHLGIYQEREEINGVVHTHSLYSSAVAACRRNIPPFLDSIVAAFGGPIEVADYARPGSRELAENARSKLAVKNGVLLANHGAIGIGCTLAKALETAQLIEKAAKTFIFASVLGGPIPLSSAEIADELNFLAKNYGQKKT